MKKISKLSLVVLALVVLFAMAFVSCEEPETTYTVWTGTVTKEVFESASKYYAPTGNNFTTSQDDEKFTKEKRDTLVAGLVKNEFIEEDLTNYIKDSLKFPATQAASLSEWFIGSEGCAYIVANNSEVYAIIVK